MFSKVFTTTVLACVGFAILLAGMWRYSKVAHAKELAPFPVIPYLLHKSWRNGYMKPVLYQSLKRRMPEAQYIVSRQRWVVAMLMRNHGHRIIPAFRRQWEPVLRLCKDYRIVIVENDSIDQTRALLLQWAAEDERVVVLCGSDVNQSVNASQCRLDIFTVPFQRIGSPIKDTSHRRIELLAMFRNMYLQYVYHHFSDFDTLMVCDPDLIGIPYEPGFWHAVSSMNQNPHLWAISSYTLTPSQRPFDPFSFALPAGRCSWWSATQKERHDQEMMRLIPKILTPATTIKPVSSSFFGCCLYRLPALMMRRPIYLYLENGYVCEHATLHAQFPPSSIAIDPFWLLLLQQNLY